MVLDAWLPVGFELPDGTTIRRPLFEGQAWQIVETEGSGRTLLVRDGLEERWTDLGLVDPDGLTSFQFGQTRLTAVSSAPSQDLVPVSEAAGPSSHSEALAFALALRATREIDPHSPLQDAIYVENITRLLPTFSISSEVPDDLILGFWLTGGVRVSVHSFRRLHQMLGWMEVDQLGEVVETAGFHVDEIVRELPPRSTTRTLQVDSDDSRSMVRRSSEKFRLPGRPQLESFINEHIVDIVLNRTRYETLGIGFPAATVLHGPPGTGKTFAVERLVEFLGWPHFRIDAASVASPYIHETSRKVSQVFEEAIENAPSVLVIDEMEAFLVDRGSGGGQHHRVEEVAEFLRRIPQAADNDVLVIAMTNRIDMIDSAILRRGRFDHVVEVGYASEAEVQSLLEHRLTSMPVAEEVEIDPIAAELAGRPLSDVAFAVREAARLAARNGKDVLDQESLLAAANATLDRKKKKEQRRIGFV